MSPLPYHRGRQVLRVHYPVGLHARLRIDGTEYPVVDLSSEGVRIAPPSGNASLHLGAQLRAALQLLDDAYTGLHRMEVLRADPGGVALRFVDAGLPFRALLDECRRILAFHAI
jgi:hypothetical protein